MALPNPISQAGISGWHHRLGKQGGTEQGQLMVQRHTAQAAPSCLPLLITSHAGPSPFSSAPSLPGHPGAHSVRPQHLHPPALGPRPHHSPPLWACCRGKKEADLQPQASTAGGMATGVGLSPLVQEVRYGAQRGQGTCPKFHSSEGQIWAPHSCPIQPKARPPPPNSLPFPRAPSKQVNGLTGQW